jgi:hypothetical protein
VSDGCAAGTSADGRLLRLRFQCHRRGRRPGLTIVVEQHDPAFLATLVAAAVPVKLTPGGRIVQNLMVR